MNQTFPYKTRWLLVVLAAIVLPTNISCSCQGIPIPPSTVPGNITTNGINKVINFPMTEVDQERSFEINIFNSEGGAITITNAAIVNSQNGVFQLKRQVFPVTLRSGPAANEALTLVVVFSPQRDGVIQAVLRLSSPNASNRNSDGFFDVTLQGVGSGSTLQQKCQDDLDFGEVLPGSQKTMRCTLTNTGKRSIHFIKLNYSKLAGGDFLDFDISPSAPPFTLAAKSSLEFAITYSPSDTKPPQDAGFFVLRGEHGITAEFRAKGRVYGAKVALFPLYNPCKSDPDCRAIDESLSCQSVSWRLGKLCQAAKPIMVFPKTSIGKTVTRTLSIRNIGGAALSITEIKLSSVSSPDFKIANGPETFPLTIEAGKHIDITIEYTPSDAVDDTGSIVVSSNDRNRPKATVDLKTQ